MTPSEVVDVIWAARRRRNKEILLRSHELSHLVLFAQGVKEESHADFSTLEIFKRMPGVHLDLEKEMLKASEANTSPERQRRLKVERINRRGSR